MLRLMILEGELVRIRSNVFPCLCVGVMIICVRFLLYTALHKEGVIFSSGLVQWVPSNN